MESVRVDTAALRAAGARADAAAINAAPGTARVQPCAPDVVSVTASTQLSAQMVMARMFTTMADGMARQFGMLLDAGATAYDDQETASAVLLGEHGPALAGRAASTVMPEAAVLPNGQGLTAPQDAGAPVGEVPAAPRDIARLIEAGRTGSGVQTWQAAQTSLQADADRLEKAADLLAAAIGKTQEGWVSQSADAATSRMRALQSWYRGHADYVRELANEVGTHVDNFRKATTEIPQLQAVADSERELRVASEANERSRGKFSAAVSHAQVKLGQLYQASTTGFTNYTVATGMTDPRWPVPPPGALADSPDAVLATGPGDAFVGERRPEVTHARAPLAPLDGGSGVEEVLNSGGSTWPPGAVDPVASNPLAGALPDPAIDMGAQVIPAIIGGVVGGVGGALGGLVGAGGNALKSMQPASMLNGLEPPHSAGGHSPQSQQPSPGPESPSGVGDMKPSHEGGSSVGDTEPAGAPGPLVAPAGVTPTQAAPVSAPVAASTLPGEAPGASPAMGAMVPPLMGGPRGGQSGNENHKQLYQDRKLKVVAPPNSEPVKGRREGRGKSRGTDQGAP